MSEIYSAELRIPKERVAILIGKKGSTKRSIEKKSKTKITVSKEGDVIIYSPDNINNYTTSNVVRAIGRGFNPDIALLLLDENNTLEIIPMNEFTRKTKKDMIRVKARLIGRQGKARMMLEILTNTHISVYGKTTAIIGQVYDVLLAKHAVEKLFQGSPHGNVYKYIDSQKKSQYL